MKCEKAMELILEGSTGGAELKSHLAKCPGCASMARQWNSLSDALPSEGARRAAPPLEIDVRIHAAALAKARSFKSRRLFFKIAASLAAAAALALALALLAVNMPDFGSRSSGIAWDSVAMGEELLKLSSEIEASSALLSMPSRELPQSRDFDKSLQSIHVEVPDFLT